MLFKKYVTLLSFLQSEEIAPCVIYTYLEKYFKVLLKREIKTGTNSLEAGNENILPSY